MNIGISKETALGERRVALVPDLVPKLTGAGLDVSVETEAGMDAGFSDDRYREKGAHIQPNVLERADIVPKVRRPAPQEISKFRENSVLIALLEPYASGPHFQLLVDRKVTAFAMELMPRIARAQPMDALSAMSTIAGTRPCSWPRIIFRGFSHCS